MNDTWTMTVEPANPPRKTLIGTPQQEAFWDALLSGSDNLLLEARAGTGKSTSAREGMWRLIEAGGRPRVRYCCFNKKVADEFREKCPPGVEVGTMHSFGLRALQRAGSVVVEPQRSYLILDTLGGNRQRWLRKAVATLVGLAKNHGLRPDSDDLIATLEDLLLHYDIETWKRTDQIVDLACLVLERSAESFAVVDFDDMLWLPVLNGIGFPSPDFLFIDECQDLNPIQHELAGLMAGSGRTVIIGDPFQSVYAFRGADSDSIPKLREQLNARTLPLTATFRCPRSHVDLARELVPDFTAAPKAPEGTLIYSGREEVDTALPGDMVLCRANAPLVSACLNMVRGRRRAIMRGRAFGDQLGMLARRIDAKTIPDLFKGVQSWKAREIAKYEAKDGCEDLIEAATDKAACLDAIAETCGSPAEVPDVIRTLFDDAADSRSLVTFSSIHRAKGSEARSVTLIDVPFAADRDMKKPPHVWELQQRRNLKYVGLTRSLDRLVIVNP